jgi:predicted transcriptional regulator
MNISKAKLKSIIHDFPDNMDIEEIMHRLYLLNKIESGEADIKSGNTVTHDEAVERISKKWQN